MPAPIGRLLQGRGKHGFFEILQRRAMMLAPARLALCAVQGTVEVAKLMVQRDDACTCKTRGAPRTEQRVILRSYGRLPVPGAVVASGACNQSHAQGALVFGGAPRTEQSVTLPLHGRVTVQEGAVQGIVLVAKFCRTARRCLHLQEWHDCAVQCTVAVAKPYRAAQRCVHLHSWHDSEVKSTVAVAKSCGAARRCVHLQD